jgi:hypothetical protein
MLGKMPNVKQVRASAGRLAGKRPHSPWAGGTASQGAQFSPFLVDNFTGGAANITGHTPDVGSGYVAAVANQSNAVYLSGSGTAVLHGTNSTLGSNNGIAVNQTVPPAADYSIAHTLTWDAAENQFFMWGRYSDTASNPIGYCVSYDHNSDNDTSVLGGTSYNVPTDAWCIYCDHPEGSRSLLGMYMQTLTQGQSYNLVFTLQGNQFTLSVNGTQVINCYDNNSTNTAAGKVAIGWRLNPSSTADANQNLSALTATQVNALLVAGTLSFSGISGSAITVTTTAATGGSGTVTY